ncbi:hypothetical protein LVJ94_19920 [Pendulispora rubella]|uniref:PEGA domain-containing protein n=1 Tax=Pendulispora rubella TaxID=2741070 RepID=A0ABZ2LFD0_9BACT
MTDTDLRKRARWAVAFGAMALISPRAKAQHTDPATAQTLFDSAKALMKEERYAEACPLLLNSQRLDPTAGTAINLALCYEKNGQTASAWARYLETVELAARLGQTERERYARERAKALAPTLSYLRIRGADLPAAAIVQRDGVVVDRALLSNDAPVDPGSHAIQVGAEGYKPWSTEVNVPSGPTHLDVDIPRLERNEPPAAGDMAADVSGASHEDVAASRRRHRTWGFVGLGAGAVGVGVGAFFGLRALSQKSDADAKCNGSLCQAGGPELQDDARRSATFSTVGFGVGLVAAGVGTYLLLTAPSAPAAHSNVATRIGFDGRSVLLEGAW